MTPDTRYHVDTAIGAACLAAAVSVVLWIVWPVKEQERPEVGRNAGDMGCAAVLPPPLTQADGPSREVIGLLPTHGEPDEGYATDLPFYSSSDEDLISRVMVSAEGRGATFEEEFLPTEAGLIGATISQWEDEDFQKMTLQEARQYLGGDAGDYDLTGDGLLLERLGGLPTRDEAGRAYETSRKVRQALLAFYAAEVIVMELQWRPDADLRPEVSSMVDRWISLRDVREDVLCATLEEKTGYKHWRLLARLWRAYER